MSETTINPRDLPTSWALTTLGTVVDYGKTEKAEPDEIPADGWVLELEDIEKDSSRILQRLTFSQRQSRSTKNRFQTGDVLYGKLRPYLNKVVVADAPGFCTTEIVPIQAGPGLDNRYLFYWLKHPAFLKYVEAESHGMNMPRLGTDTGKTAPFVVAPRPEQARIADQLDILLARVQAYKDKLDAVLQLLKRFRQSVLQAAVSGDLTMDWRAERENVRPWSTMRLANVVREVRNSLPAKPTAGPSGKRILRISAVRPGVLNTSDYRYLDVSGSAAANASLECGDILFTRYNGTLEYVGVCAPVRRNMPGYVYPDKLIRVRVKSDVVLPEFLALVCNSPQVRKQVETFIKSSAGQKGISGSDLKSINLPVPGLSEQAEVIRRVNTLLELADRIEAQCAAVRTQFQRLTPLLLAKAFRGELAAQDPNDEPASELLARLSNPAAASKRKRVVQRTSQATPAPAGPPPMDWQTLPDDAWANGAAGSTADPTAVHTVHMAAVLKAWGAPVPAGHVRLAALLSLRPHLLPATLDKALLRQWRRLVGAEADPLPAVVARLSPRADPAWRQALAKLRARGELIEDLKTATWGPGLGLEHIDTRGWPDGRAGWLVHLLRSHGVEALLPAMAAAEQVFGYAQAA